MGFFSGILDIATKAVGGLIGGGNPIGGLVETASHALGGLIGDVTGDKLGDKVGDAIGGLIHNDKIGDFLGDAIGGEHKVTDFLAEKSGGIGDKLGDLFGSDKAGDALGSVLGGMSGEEAGSSHATVMPEAAAMGVPGRFDLSNLTGKADAAAMPEASQFDGSMDDLGGDFADMPMDMGSIVDGPAMAPAEMPSATNEMMF